MLLDHDDEFTQNQGGYNSTLPNLLGQLVTANANGGRVKDAGAARDWAAGELVVPFAKVTANAAANPTTSMTISIVGADTADLATNPVTLSTVTVLTAALIAGALIPMPPLTPGKSKRYLGCTFANAGGAPTTGAWVVGLVGKNARIQAWAPQSHAL
jgi:hypothetical protein